MVGDVEMRQRIESQALLQLAPVDLEERAWMWGPRIGHHKADIEIVGELSEIIQEVNLREIRHNGARFDTEFIRQGASKLFKQGFPSGHEHNIDARSRNLAGELSADAR